jgi:hypothetical protein
MNLVAFIVGNINCVVSVAVYGSISPDKSVTKSNEEMNALTLC